MTAPSYGRLHELGLRHGTDKATFHGYCDFYEEHLPPRDTVTRLLEVGIMHGASLRMWHDWFTNAQIYGVDNDYDLFDSAEAHRCGLIYADATKADDVRERLAPFGPYDVIIDDGSHLTQDQQDAWYYLWPHLRPGGAYVIEDLHTSYMANYVNSQQTTIEWLKTGELLGWYPRVTWFARRQGAVQPFISRHGFNPDSVEWLGDPEAASITAIIRKPAE